MNVETFDPTVHFEQVNDWCRAWGLGAFTVDWLPPNTFIVPGAAFACLFLTDGGLAWLSSVISPRGGDRTLVQAAIHAIAERATDVSRCAGKLGLATFPTVSSLTRHFFEAGFTPSSPHLAMPLVRRI